MEGLKPAGDKHDDHYPHAAPALRQGFDTSKIQTSSAVKRTSDVPGTLTDLSYVIYLAVDSRF